MPEHLNPTELVKAWYTDSAHFRPSGKSPACADHQLLAMVDLSEKRVLNLGCYYPEDELAFGGKVRYWAAVDFCPEVIQWCRELPGMPKQVAFYVHDICAMTFANESFDIVCDFSTGDHLTLADFRRMLKEVKRVLKPDGVFLLSYQNTDYFVGEPLEFFEQDSGYSRSISPKDVAALLKRWGFRVIQQCAIDQPRAGLLAKKISS